MTFSLGTMFRRWTTAFGSRNSRRGDPFRLDYAYRYNGMRGYIPTVARSAATPRRRKFWLTPPSAFVRAPRARSRKPPQLPMPLGRGTNDKIRHLDPH